MEDRANGHVALMAETHVTFRFVVELDGQAAGAFMECTLPTLEWEVEEVKEGGVNGYIHQLPGRRKSARLTLKNGLGNNALMRWALDQLGKEKHVVHFERKSVTLKLLDSHGEPVVTWLVERAYPMKWTGPVLKTSDNTIAIQTLELACGRVVVEVAA